MNKNKSSIWIWSVTVASVGLIIAEIICANVLADSDIQNSIQKSIAGWVSFYAVAVFTSSIIAIFNVKKWLKIIPVITALIAVPIFGLAFFAYGFIGYGSQY